MVGWLSSPEILGPANLKYLLPGPLRKSLPTPAILVL